MNDTPFYTLNISENDLPSTYTSLHPDDQAMIDQTLRVVADSHVTLSNDLGLMTADPSLKALRQSPLGLRLHRLIDAANGQSDVEALHVRADAEDVIATLLRPLAATEHEVPVWFWQTAIGEMLATAIYRSYEVEGLLSLSNAAERLQEDRASIEQLIEAGMLTAVHDETGKPFVPVMEIEHLQTIARAFDGPSLPAADSLVATRAA